MQRACSPVSRAWQTELRQKQTLGGAAAEPTASSPEGVWKTVRPFPRTTHKVASPLNAARGAFSSLLSWCSLDKTTGELLPGTTQSISGSDESTAANSAPLPQAAETALRSDSIWAQAWKALEPPRRASGISGRQRGVTEAEAGGKTEGEATVLRKPSLALQGLTAPARAQLLALSLVALERQVSGLPSEFVRCGTEAEWKLLLPALWASCSLDAALGWLGYIPQDVETEAAALISELRAGSSAYEIGLALPWEHVSGTSQPPRAAPSEAGAAEAKEAHLWALASEKATIHAIVLKHLSEGVPPESNGPGSLAGAACDALHSQNGTSSSATTGVETGLKHRARRGGPRGAQRGHGHPWLSFLRAAGDQLKQLWPLVPADGLGGGRPAADRDSAAAESATRAAALKLLTARGHGVRGWGVRGAGPFSSSIDPVIESAPWILQDIAVVVAEAVAASYLAEAAQGLSGGPAKGKSLALQTGSWPTFLHPNLSSTRSLERFRNQIGFQQFVSQSWEGVVAIYEDKHILWGLGPGASIRKRAVSVRRAQELRSLTGWRAAVSVALEALDFVAPLLQKLVKRGGEAFAWLLVALIGRSLGLVFRGVRQSLMPGRKPKSKSETALAYT